ncbi:MAG: ribose-5-phosphate isomerase RpiA [Rhodospirillaceae bacterium]|nr:ribose-5-phosphate isomerase RpiA [Rhodospirillaceae bacterium]
MASDREALKRRAAERAVAEIRDGMVVGLGTGSTAALAVAALGERVRAGQRVCGIPTSERTAALAREAGVPLTGFNERPVVDLAFDGADEVERGTLNLIKGRGGALLREKIVAQAARRLVIVVDDSKLVDRLGERVALPVEVVPFGWQASAARLRGLGGAPSLRRDAGGRPFLTDNGHYVLDCAFGPIPDPAALAAAIDAIAGVVESGLFLGMASAVVVAGEGGVEVLEAPPRASRT